MNNIKSVSPSEWGCNHHIVFAPKYRQQVLYGNIKADIGKILRQVCERMLSRSYSSIGFHTAASEDFAVHGIVKERKRLDDI